MMALPRLITIIVTLACWLGSGPMARAETTPLPLLLQQTQFITYTPRSFKVMGATITAATEAGIRADLRVLKPLFNGLITYSCVNGQERIPAIAQELGFRAIIIGVWDPRSRVEIANAIRVTKRYPGLVAAVVVGNEGIFTKRYRPDEVKQAMARIKGECPTLAVTTSEPFTLYFQKEYRDFFQAHDLLMPNVHPVFEPWFKPEEPEQGVMMVVNVAAQFTESYHLPLLIKETGMPSGPPDRSGYSEKRQALFWSELYKRFPFAPFRAVACFEAFDTPWKPAAMAVDFPGDHASEAFWGFFTATGKAKEVVTAVNRRQKFLRPADAPDQSR